VTVAAPQAAEVAGLATVSSAGAPRSSWPRASVNRTSTATSHLSQDDEYSCLSRLATRHLPAGLSEGKFDAAALVCLRVCRGSSRASPAAKSLAGVQLRSAQGVIDGAVGSVFVVSPVRCVVNLDCACLSAFGESGNGPTIAATRAQGRQREQQTQAEFVPGEVLVRFKAAVPADRQAEVLRGEGAAILRKVERLRVQVLAVKPDRMSRRCWRSCADSQKWSSQSRTTWSRLPRRPTHASATSGPRK